ncbi:MAG: metal-dependent transcriptional regulator [Clostridiales Family XIII bacterium]|jgi:Mn-dependent DtxR family transcriptional regulator|nr:metal-dependent transcriptional regulator [Clostridiales Family XIII bacterium]
MEKLSPAMEDYLKNICLLSGPGAEDIVHVSELALRMGVSKACASRATNTLSEKGLIWKSKYQGVSLNSEGRERAGALLRRHSTLRRFFSEILRVDPAVADKDACKVEHSLSAESYRSICDYLENAR